VAHVVVDGEVVSHLRAGQFIGEMSYVRQQETSADVVFAERSRYVYWPRDKLRALLARHGRLERTFEALLGQDLADKLHRMQ
jgi:CRP-like cAMP-binding protein